MQELEFYLFKNQVIGKLSQILAISPALPPPLCQQLIFSKCMRAESVHAARHLNRFPPSYPVCHIFFFFCLCLKKTKNHRFFISCTPQTSMGIWGTQVMEIRDPVLQNSQEVKEKWPLPELFQQREDLAEQRKPSGFCSIE